MGKQLIIVESPAKVKTIKKFLGPQYMVQASVGHVRDLPSSSLGVDEANDFAPQYEIIDNKKNVVSELRSAAAKADTVYLAPDPDREGEAIAWHVAELIRDKAKDIKRIQFNEITARAVKEALAHPRELNQHLFDAQQARRVLDRLVGYKISPLLWKTIKRGISAGRVQSVALRLIVEREAERAAFKPEEYWLFKALLGAEVPPSVRAELARIGGKKAVIRNAEEANALEAELKGQPFVVESVEQKERERAPQPPFITSTLQQAANQRLSYTAKRTMNIAQRLYEGVEMEDGSITALITYMRTDSTRIADEARQAAHDFIQREFGNDYLPAKKRVYKTKSGAQDAHEAIRPVDVNITPEMVKAALPPDQYNLYRLIWSRFVASQMAGARFHDTTVTVACGRTQWKAKGERLLFPGFLAVLPRGKDEGDAELPPLEAGQTLKLEKLDKEQKFTQPPARYSEASLVRELEEQGIGRPSTYAPTVSTILDREYVMKEGKYLRITNLGRVVTQLMEDRFSDVADLKFTANMEKKLDDVEEGTVNWKSVLRDFYGDFEENLKKAEKDLEGVHIKVPDEVSEEICPVCGRNLVVKSGRFGRFLACPGFPECNFTMPLVVEMPGRCPKCGGRLFKRTGTSRKSGKQYTYYCCEHTNSRAAGGATCDFMTWDVPVKDDCPLCGKTLFKRAGKGYKRPYCINPECANFLPEDKRGYPRKPAEASANAEEAPGESDAPAEEKAPAKKAAVKKTAAAEKKPAARKTCLYYTSYATSEKYSS